MDAPHQEHWSLCTIEKLHHHFRKALHDLFIFFGHILVHNVLLKTSAGLYASLVEAAR